jgi:hypothetical protein
MYRNERIIAKKTPIMIGRDRILKKNSSKVCDFIVYLWQAGFTIIKCLNALKSRR